MDEGEPAGSRMMSAKERADLKAGRGEGFVKAQARKIKGGYVPMPGETRRSDQAAAQQVFRGAGFAPTIQGAARRKESAAPAARRKESAAPPGRRKESAAPAAQSKQSAAPA